MTYKLNLGAWGSIFAVPTSVVDSHLKIATESQLKVLLYILRNSEKENTLESISKNTSIHVDEVKNAVDFWIERSVIASFDDELSLPEHEKERLLDDESKNEPVVKQKPRAMSRAQRPDSMFVARRLTQDQSLAQLMDEAQIALSKPLSSGDTATLVMLHDTDGLPCEVLALLINYCVSIGKGNMRAIERMGINWASEGIFTLSDAEAKITSLSRSNNAWDRVSKVFGLKNVGSPTKTQLQLSDCWINDWKFSDEMLREAYERCVNLKGEFNIKYINGILSKWFSSSIFNIDDLAEHDAKISKKRNKTSEEKRDASYDLETFESKSLFKD